MSYTEHLYTFFKTQLFLISLLALTGCGSSDDNSGSGYFRLYNTSTNAPTIYLTVDQYNDDDYNEKTHSGVAYTKISSLLEYETDTYNIELAWEGDDYDLELIYEEQIKIKKNNVNFIVFSEDVQTPNVKIYDIAIRDDNEINDDNDDDLFNIRFLNMYNESTSIDIYMSEENETFNEAQLVAQVSYTEMAENQKLDQDSYIFYITEAGSEEILFTSAEISFPYASKYIISVRENKGAGSSPFVIDKISTSSIIEYADVNSEAAFRIYNGIIEHELLPDYQSSIDLHVNGIDDTAELSNITFGQFSEKVQTEFGDYSISLVSSNDNSPVIENHLLTLSENSNKTIFFYLTEDNVDEDGDGDVDEDGDGYVDEIEISVNSLVVNNSQSESIYTHKINIINLIDNDDFDFVGVYFVRSDEIINNASNSITASYITPNTISLNNNTYSVYIIAHMKSSDILISSAQLILNEDSKDQFLILETNHNSVTGYEMAFTNQKVD